MKAFTKHALSLLALCMGADVSSNEVWVPGTKAGAYLEYVTLNTNRSAIDPLSWQDRTRVEFGFDFDTTTYFILPDQFGYQNERSMEVYRTLRDAMINKIPVNVQVDNDTRDFLQIRLGVSDHPLTIRRQSGGVILSAEERGERIDLLGRNRKSMPGQSWQGTLPARR